MNDQIVEVIFDGMNSAFVTIHYYDSTLTYYARRSSPRGKNILLQVYKVPSAI